MEVDGWDVLESFQHEQSSQPGTSQSQTQTPQLTAIEREIEIWNQVIPRTKDLNVNILAFWKKHTTNLPLLSSLAKKVLCVPVSSASSERVFSEGGRVISNTRTLLNPETAEDLIWMHQNYDELAPLIDRWVTRWSEYRKRDKAEQKELDRAQGSQELAPTEEDPDEPSEEEPEEHESECDDIIEIPDDDENEISESD